MGGGGGGDGGDGGGRQEKRSPLRCAKVRVLLYNTSFPS